MVERFDGHRVHSRTGVLRRVRSLLGLIVIGLVLATVLAAVVAVAVGGIAIAVQHSLGNR